jgi:hypothetical protein
VPRLEAYLSRARDATATIRASDNAFNRRDVEVALLLLEVDPLRRVQSPRSSSAA